MTQRFLEIASTAAVHVARVRYGSATHYAKLDGSSAEGGSVINETLGSNEVTFISARDGFYLASVSETGWPYVQFRGGPLGFLRVVDEHTLGFADFRGNRQYITTGNVMANDRVSLFLMDYPNRRRLKIFGHMQSIDASDDPGLAAELAVPDYRAKVERSVLIKIEAFDWNCPQHIVPRFTEAELEPAPAPLA